MKPIDVRGPQSLPTTKVTSVAPTRTGGPSATASATIVDPVTSDVFETQIAAPVSGGRDAPTTIDQVIGLLDGEIARAEELSESGNVTIEQLRGETQLLVLILENAEVAPKPAWGTGEHQYLSTKVAVDDIRSAVGELTGSLQRRRNVNEDGSFTQDAFWKLDWTSHMTLAKAAQMLGQKITSDDP